MALRIKAAFSRDITGVTQAGIVERAVPAAPLPPFGPCDIIAIFGVGISRFPGRTIDALGGEARVDSHMPSRRGSCQHRTKHCGSADQSEFHHAFLRFVLMRYLDPFQALKFPAAHFSLVWRRGSFIVNATRPIAAGRGERSRNHLFRNFRNSACGRTQISHIYSAVSPHSRGVSRSSRTRGGMRWTRAALLTRALACGRRSRVVPTPRRWRQVGGSAMSALSGPTRGILPAMVTNKPGHQGEREGNR